MKVNMTPNPLDVVTIHASQGDSEARQWEFELHNNGELIDTSDVTEQMFFKAYKGGTEQILPVNGSTPTTSPFKGDIKYPQGLLSDQEFLYRESPTEEDGLAKITSIKGNTLVWNQLVQNGNFADTSNWTKGSGASSLAISNNEAVITISGPWNNDVRQNQGASFISGHKYFASFEAKASVPISLGLATINATPAINFATLTNLQTTFKKSASIVTAQSNADSFRIVLVENGSSYVGETFTVRNVQIIDLTAMGLDISNLSDFTSLFPLPYYAYNQGTLLSFNGTGIKTTGKNFVNVDFELLKVRNSLGTWNGTEYTYQGVTFKVNFTSQGYIDSVVANGTATANANLNLMRLLRPSTFFNKPITMSGCPSGGSSSTYRMTLQMQTSPYTAIGHDYGNGLNATIPDNGEDYQAIIRIISGYTCNNVVFRPMITLQGVDQTFEPHTESATSLPISTYFPTGMKSAGSVYDELTNSKAITRIGEVDLGTLTWSYQSGNARFQSSSLSNIIVPSTRNFLSTKYEYGSTTSVNQTIQIGANGNVYIKDSAYTDATTFKNSLSGVYLYYELATPTETSFTTASLVTENAEIPLSNEDGVLIGKCTEQLSSESGFFDAKIKLADEDGECYSNKIQLHIERSPQ